MTDGGSPKILKEVTVKVVNWRECAKNYSDINFDNIVTKKHVSSF